MGASQADFRILAVLSEEQEGTCDYVVTVTSERCLVYAWAFLAFSSSFLDFLFTYHRHPLCKVILNNLLD